MRARLLCLAILSAMVLSAAMLWPSTSSAQCVTWDGFERRFSLGNLIHEYGDPAFGENDTLLAAHPTFTAAFELYLTPGASAVLTDSLIEYIVNTIADEDTSDLSDDFYPIVWNYFCHADQDPSYPGVEFTVGSTTYDNFRIILYDPADMNLDPTTFTVVDPDTCFYGNDGDALCEGYSTAGGNTVILSVCGNTPSTGALLGQGFAHEFQHLAFAANGSVAVWGPGGGSMPLATNEALSTLAEHMVRNYRWSVESPYDASIYMGEDCDADRKYVVWKAWMAYLYDVFSGPSSAIEDDAMYRWIRSEGSTTDFEISMQTLADVLWSSDFDYLGGDNATRRFQNAFARFAVAKFVNAPGFDEDGVFGYDELNSQTYLRFFDDVWASSGSAGFDCANNLPGGTPAQATGAGWNARVLPPVYEVGGEVEDTTWSVSGIYTDEDGSSDYIDVAIYGTDYIIFNADSYYDDDNQHDFVFSMSGDFESETYNDTLQVWLIAYDVENDENAYGGSTLPQHADDILYVEPLTPSKWCVGGEDYCVDAVVSDFGRLVKSVVIVIAPLESFLQSGNGGRYPTLFTYEYEYGVYSHTPGTTTRWKGDVFVNSDAVFDEGTTLEIDGGTYVHIAAEDWLHTMTGQVHFWIWGDIDINGTAGTQVQFLPWDGSSPWDGIVLQGTDVTADIAWLHAVGSSNGIDIAGGDVTIKHSTIESCSYAVVARWGATVDMEFCYLVDNNSGLVIQDTATVVCELSTFQDNTVGVSSTSYGDNILGKLDGAALTGGKNRFLDNTFHVIASGDTAWAQQCWWGTDECPPVGYYGTLGPVVCEPPLASDPYSGGGGGGDGQKYPDPTVQPTSPVVDNPALSNSLVNAYPNPFNPEVTIEYSVAAAGGAIRVDVYNVRGQHVTTLVDERRPGGLHTVRWSGANTNGQAVPSGIYFVRMLAPGFEQSRKIVLLK